MPIGNEHVDICHTCGRVHTGDYNPRHPFNDGSITGKDVFFAELEDAVVSEPRLSPFPFDPVLRQALIDKGVLTPDDLRDAEAKIVVVTGQFREAVRDDGTASGAAGRS